mgnify:CR=1 FL=1
MGDNGACRLVKIVLDEENVFHKNILKSVLEYQNSLFFESLPSYHIKKSFLLKHFFLGQSLTNFEFWNMIPTGSSNQCPAKTLLMSALMPHAKRGKLEIK